VFTIQNSIISKKYQDGEVSGSVDIKTNHYSFADVLWLPQEKKYTNLGFAAGSRLKNGLFYCLNTEQYSSARV
jgi:hypothetical protein